MMQFFDTHCHLQDERYGSNVENVIARAKNAGVRYFLCCGSTEKDWEHVANLARKHIEIIPAFGLHPWYINSRSNRWLDTLKGLLDTFPNAAVGEIGLDHDIDSFNRDEQNTVFCQQLEYAQQFNRAISIHCRHAWGDLLETMSQYDKFSPGAVIHSYSGSVELIPQLEKLGCFFSLSGSVTYNRNKRAHKAAASIPLSKLLIETDSPDIPPEHYQGNNEPSTIISINDTIAQIRGISSEVCSEHVFNNACTLLLI